MRRPVTFFDPFEQRSSRSGTRNQKTASSLRHVALCRRLLYTLQDHGEIWSHQPTAFCAMSRRTILEHRPSNRDARLGQDLLEGFWLALDLHRATTPTALKKATRAGRVRHLYGANYVQGRKTAFPFRGAAVESFGGRASRGRRDDGRAHLGFCNAAGPAPQGRKSRIAGRAGRQPYCGRLRTSCLEFSSLYHGRIPRTPCFLSPLGQISPSMMQITG